LDFFYFSDPDSTEHKEQFYRQLSQDSSPKAVFRDQPDSQRDTDCDTDQIDRQQYILFFYSDEEIIIYLLDEAPEKDDSQKGKDLIGSPRSQ
jgi:hypothetical protein